MNPGLHHLCLLLGSNIQPEVNLPLAIDLLRKHVSITRLSSVWESKAVGSDAANILNLALLASSSRTKESLKAQVITPLEAQLGRVRTRDKNAPRTIDIDILIYDGGLLEPALWQSAFRLVPLAEILPDFRSPAGESLREAALRLSASTPIWVRADVKIVPFSPSGE